MDHSEVIISSEYIKIRFLSFWIHTCCIHTSRWLVYFFHPKTGRRSSLTDHNSTYAVSLHLHLWLGELVSFVSWASASLLDVLFTSCM